MKQDAIGLLVVEKTKFKPNHTIEQTVWA